ncbi:MAG: hypothetical protein ACLFUI_04930 [Halanaerobiales bacterium]
MDLMKKMEEAFFDYATKYDENIKTLVQEHNIEISVEELEEILADAKNITVK